MRSIVLLALGAVAGVFAARKLQQTEKGQQLFDVIDARTREFTDAVKDGYQSRDRELRGE